MCSSMLSLKVFVYSEWHSKYIQRTKTSDYTSIGNCKRLKIIENYKTLSTKKWSRSFTYTVLVVVYERSNCKALTGKRFVFWRSGRLKGSGHLREVVVNGA